MDILSMKMAVGTGWNAYDTFSRKDGLIVQSYITRNGKVVAKLSNPYQDRVDVAKSLFGVLSNDMTLEEAREERLNTIWEF